MMVLEYPGNGGRQLRWVPQEALAYLSCIWLGDVCPFCEDLFPTPRPFYSWSPALPQLKSQLPCCSHGLSGLVSYVHLAHMFVEDLISIWVGGGIVLLFLLPHHFLKVQQHQESA